MAKKKVTVKFQINYTEKIPKTSKEEKTGDTQVIRSRTALDFSRTIHNTKNKIK